MLVSLREAHHLTIRALSEASGVSVAQISALERPSRTGQPDLRVRRKTVLDLARGLDLSATERASFLVAAGHADLRRSEVAADRVEVARALLAVTQEGVEVDGEPAPVARDVPKLPASAATAADVIEVASDLFELAARRGSPKPDEVIITFLAPGTNVLDAVPGLRGRWESAIAALLNSGIRVTHVWELREGDVARARDKARNVLAYGHMSDLYEPLCVRPDAPPDVLGIPDLIVVPGYAAMLKVVPGSQAIVLQDASQIAMAHLAAQTVKRNAKKVLYAYSADQDGLHGFDKQIGQDEAEIRGMRRIFKAGPTSLWINPDREIELARRVGHSAESLSRLSDAARMRFDAIEDQLRIHEYSHRELIPRRTIERFARDRRPPRDTWWAIGGQGGVRYEVDDVVDALNRVISRLTEYPHYELALAGDELERGLATAFWEVMTSADGAHSAVYLETWRADAQLRGPGLIIREPALVDGFNAWFDMLWGSVPDRWRNRKHLIPWLEKQIRAAQSAPQPH